jgi:hypothetical protein
MTKLHELLAVEKSLSNQANKLLADTTFKFNKFEYFQGHTKALKMLNDSTENDAIESAARDIRQLPTTVVETLEYALDSWKNAEDVIFQKNVTNQLASGDIELDGKILATQVPVDELLGLESRLDSLRKVMEAMPTLPAAVECRADTKSGRKGSWVTVNDEVTTKTEKLTVPVVLYEATDKHPAQVKEVSADRIVGKFTKQNTYGAATSAEKAEVIGNIDKLINAVKQARMRANLQEVKTNKIGGVIVDYIMSPFNK